MIFNSRLRNTHFELAHRYNLLLILYGFIFWILYTFGINCHAKELVKENLFIGFSHRTFLNVNPTDAKASLKVLAYTFGKEAGFDLDIKSTIYGDLNQFKKDILNNTLQLIIMDTWEMLQMDFDDQFEITFITKEGIEYSEGFLGEEYLLLVNKEQSINKIQDLKDQTILVLETTNTHLAQPWLHCLLLDKQVFSEKQFSTQTQIVRNPMDAVLPVFFKKMAACVVDQSSYQVLSELNPQLSKSLSVLTRSKPFVNSVIVVSRGNWSTEQNRETLMRNLIDLHKSPQGRQIMDLFGVSRFIPFEEKYLQNVRELKYLHDRVSEDSNLDNSE